MSKMKFYVALAAAKMSVLMLKVTGHNGTNFPGVVALKICPDFLKYIDRPKRIIAVTGTNGKTTVSNMLTEALSNAGIKVLNNGLGSNINTGIATCLISGVSALGKSKYEMAVLEVDERSSIRIFPYVEPDYMIITNLSRDSIMRNAHPEYIGNFLSKYTPSKTKLILNADDIVSANILPENDKVYFGIKKMDSDRTESVNLIDDMPICPKCHSRIRYEYLRYSNIGKAFCPECDFKAPEYDYYGDSINLFNKKFLFGKDNEEMEFPVYNDGIFNIYNQVAVYTMLSELGYSMGEIKKMTEGLGIVKTRYDVESVGDISLIMQLSKDKNAYAGSRVFEYIRKQPGKKELVLMMNSLGDVEHWSENICWLYDCDFEYLNDDSITNIVATGPRGKDYLLRLLMADVHEERVSFCNKETDAYMHLKYEPGESIYILYGTDSIGLAKEVRDNIRKKIEEERK